VHRAVLPLRARPAVDPLPRRRHAGRDLLPVRVCHLHPALVAERLAAFGDQLFPDGRTWIRRCVRSSRVRRMCPPLRCSPR
jgi:hypothetical protein